VQGESAPPAGAAVAARAGAGWAWTVEAGPAEAAEAAEAARSAAEGWAPATAESKPEAVEAEASG
jgi:hypothetical protein